jgi:hypothetical protein
MNAIHQKHESLINGLTKLYDTLIALHYISPIDVLRPRHTNPPIRVAGLQKLGFDAEVISLVQLLPGLSHEVTWGFRDKGIQLLPRSKAVHYFQEDALVHDLMDEFRRWAIILMTVRKSWSRRC